MGQRDGGDDRVHPAGAALLLPGGGEDVGEALCDRFVVGQRDEFAGPIEGRLAKPPQPGLVGPPEANTQLGQSRDGNPTLT